MRSSRCCGPGGQVRASTTTASDGHSTASTCARYPYRTRSRSGSAASGPKALQRVGRLGDGWLGAGLSPAEARRGSTHTIELAARDAGRTIDTEHFGLSLAYARVEPDAEVLARLGARHRSSNPTALLPVGRDELRRLVAGYVDAGISKFVLRPLDVVVELGRRAQPGWPMPCSTSRPDPDLAPTNLEVCASVVAERHPLHKLRVGSGQIEFTQSDSDPTRWPTSSLVSPWCMVSDRARSMTRSQFGNPASGLRWSMWANPG